MGKGSGKMNKNHRKAISRGQRKRHARIRKELPPVKQYEKVCCVCEIRKHVDLEEPGFSEFVIRKKKLASGGVGLFPASECRECAKLRVEAWREKQRATGDLARREREWNERRDQEARKKYHQEYQRRARATRRGRYDLEDESQEFYLNDKLRLWLREHMTLLSRTDKRGSELGADARMGLFPTPEKLAELSGVPLLRLRKLTHSQRKHAYTGVEIRDADALLTAYGRHDLLGEMCTQRVWPRVAGIKQNGQPAVTWVTNRRLSQESWEAWRSGKRARDGEKVEHMHETESVR